MRISDWSSDVCSSDLRYDDVDHAQAIDADIETAGEAADDAGDHAVAARAAKRCGVAHGDPQCAENSWTASTSTRTCSGSMSGARPWPRLNTWPGPGPDRKSVGEGKSGYVRVDLGG